jgi:hypothetical protein
MGRSALAKVGIIISGDDISKRGGVDFWFTVLIEPQNRGAGYFNCRY